MKFGVTSLALSTLLATSALAAPKPLSIDLSGSSLMDSATSDKIWTDNLPARVIKLYPAKKFRFASEVTGGFNEAKLCVVSARVMLLPVVFLPIQGTKVVYAPLKSASTYDAWPALTQEQCQDAARTKLKEAIQSLTSSLAAS